MHIPEEEIGNQAAACSHDHEHHHDHAHPHDHEHSHSHEHHHDHGHSHDAAGKGDKALALLSYMYGHNVDHTRELLDMAAEIEAGGKTAVAAKMREAAEAFNQGNDLLHEALHLYEE